MNQRPSNQAFIDPTPISPELLMESELPIEAGGVPVVVVVIVACGGKLGSATVITVGTIGVTVLSETTVN